MNEQKMQNWSIAAGEEMLKAVQDLIQEAINFGMNDVEARAVVGATLLSAWCDIQFSVYSQANVPLGETHHKMLLGAKSMIGLFIDAAAKHGN